MAGKVAVRQAKLRAALIDAAEAQIAAGGLSALKARPIAAEAGCSVGAIYNFFDDLNALVMAVNGRTFRRLGAFVSAAVAEAAADDPNAQMVTMSHAYLHFASDHTHLWRALFDLEMSVEGPVPDWYLQELGAVFGLIAVPLAQLFPDMKRPELDLMVRGLFSSVHGIVLLGLEKRISAVPLEQIEKMLEQILRQIGN
ncbi:MAG: TetR/AcrR family transcriptional regulator [Sulfitobacter sp.]